MEKDILYKLLKSEYKTQKWKDIVTVLFPNRDFFAYEVPVELSNQYQKDGAKKIIQFGNITLDDGSTLALYEVELQPKKKIAKNRVELRNLLSAQIIPGVVDGALISYFEKGQKDWRFTFISKSFYWDEQGNSIKKETHPKRYTYVLGEDEACITPRERFWYLIEKRTKTVKDVLEAFSVEKISKEFFAKYKKHYQAFVDELMNSHFSNSLFRGDDKAVRDFVKKMMGRIVFLFFLQKKGWLDVPLNKNYGDGNKRFLQDLFNAHKNDSFYTICLVPLFFDTLNNPDDEVYKVTGTKIPFLNGGLFERDEIEKKKAADFIIFKAKLFEEFFDFFDEYNFTIDESSPDDQDIGIDPEMLGHIFENLLEDNRGKGAYYTPKMIVQYMCQETLIQYLKAHMGDKKEFDEFIRYKKRGEENAKENFIRDNASEINRLLDNLKICDPAIGSGAFPMGLLLEIFQAKLVLNWTLQKDKAKIKRQIIQNSIYGVDKDKGAVDIARLRFWLSLIVDEEVKLGEKPSALPNFDYKIMQGNSLFESFKGFSLKYYEQQEEPVQKNLFETDNRINFFKKTHSDLVKLEKEYYDPENYHRKETIRDQIDELVGYSIETSFKEKIKEHKTTLKALKNKASSSATLKNKNDHLIKKLEKEIEEMDQALIDIKPLIKKDEKPWFLWHLFFKDVLGENKNGDAGFDIVIGNPPYIRQEMITDIKPYLETLDGKTNYKVYNSISDIYTYFFELGHRLLKKERGIFSFICSKKYTRARYGKNLRQYLLQNTQLTGYTDFNEVQVFGATVDTSILFFQTVYEIPHNYYFLYTSVNNDLQQNVPLIDYIEKNGRIYDRKFLDIETWSFSNPNEEKIKLLIQLVGKKIKDWDIEFNRGITSGFNEAFYIDNKTRENLIKSDPNCKDIIKPILRGRDITRYKYEFKDTWMIYVPWHFPLHKNEDISGASKEAEQAFKLQYPSLYNHLYKFKDKLSDRNKAETGIRYEWYALQRFANTFFENFDKDKVIWLVLTDKASFAYEKEGLLVNDSVFLMIGENLKYLLSVLNSKLSEWFFDKITTSSGVGTNMWKKTYVEQIPIPEIPKSKMRPFEVLVDYIAFIKKTDKRISQYTPNEHMATNFEEILDACVYELYFKDHMEEKGITVLSEVNHLLQPIEKFDEKNDAEKISKIINQAYDAYKSSDNIIRQKISDFPVKSPDIINVIQNG